MNRVIQLPSAMNNSVVRSLERTNSEPAIRTDTVYVVFTSIGETLAAMHVAGDFARVLGVPITIVHFRTVPYALPADEPNGLSPAETDAFIERLRDEHEDVRIRVYLCRDERQAVPLAFKPHSLIVIAGRPSYWPTRSERWRRMLEAAGHYVILANESRKRGEQCLTCSTS